MRWPISRASWGRASSPRSCDNAEVRVTVLYNTDYDDDDTDVDAISVKAAATAIVSALVEAGHVVDLRGIAGFDVFEVLAKLRVDKPELVFNLCESMAGEPRNEPTLVGLLDLFAIPYTGADLLALASCLYKHRCKEILIARGVDTPPYRVIDRQTIDDPALETLDYPWFLKLLHEDASVGITEENVVHTPAALRKRALALFELHQQPVLAERYIEGREINVTLVGNGADLRVLPLHEIDFAAMPSDRPRIVSYAAKWDESHVDYAGTKPVPLRDANPALVAAVETTARAAWAALELRDYGRVDLRVDRAGKPWVIDINPNCDISPDAGVARAAKVAGMTYAQLIDSIAQAARRRIGG
jgi:D-alanine-D-alanine ligase